MHATKAVWRGVWEHYHQLQYIASIDQVNKTVHHDTVCCHSAGYQELIEPPSLQLMHS